MGVSWAVLRQSARDGGREKLHGKAKHRLMRSTGVYKIVC